MSTLIQIRNLAVRRENRIVLEVTKLDITRGETMAVVGSNGSGKSTLLLVLAHLLPSPIGSILWEGQPVPSRRDLAYRRRIGLVMQDALLLNRSVFENAALGLHFRGIPRVEISHRVDPWLERLGISHLRQRSAHSLSGGEARRVALVRALVLEPALLLLDEPFAALDRSSRARLQEDMKSILGGEHITTIFSTHSELDVQKLASCRIELENGRLLEG